MKRILIIEDEPHISNLVKFILQKNGFEVLQAFVGQEGMEIARKERPNLIILDVMMPHVDGFEVARTLTREEGTKNIPIIMLSSAAQFKDKIRGIESGALEYITKPFDKQDLLTKVKKYIN